MSVARILFPATGPQVFLAGYRCHHGAAGLLVGACGAATWNRPLLLIGLALAWHDRADWRQWWPAR
jgi:hypothetical protein